MGKSIIGGVTMVIMAVMLIIAVLGTATALSARDLEGAVLCLVIGGGVFLLGVKVVSKLRRQL